MDNSKILLIRGGGLCKMCRICLARDVTLASLYSFSAQLSGPIIDSVRSCATVRVLKHDGMPLFICKQCYLQMLQVNKFQKLAKSSEQKLKWYLRKLSSCGNVPRNRCDSGVQNQSCSRKKVIDSSTVEKSNVSAKLYSNNILKQNLRAEPINASTLPINTVPSVCTAVTGQQTLISTINIENNIDDSVIVINDDVEAKISTSDIERKTHRRVNDRRPLSSKNDTNIDLRTTAKSDNGNVSNNGSKKLQNRNKETDLNTVTGQNNTVPSNHHSPLHDDDDHNMVLVIDESEPEQLRSDTKNLSKNIQKQTTTTVENDKNTENDSTELVKPTKKSKILQDQIRFFKERQLNLKYRKKCFECSICSVQFYSTMEILRHKKKHPNMKVFKCDSCNCLFRKWSQLCRHERMYEGKCMKQTARQPTCQSPKKQHKQPKNKYTCAICIIDFKYIRDLRKHNLAHPSCTVCEKIFTDRVSLNSHECEPQLIHECDICNKRFKKSTALINHRTTHGIKKGEKIFVCDVCRKRFDTLICLVEHKRTHDKLD